LQGFFQVSGAHYHGRGAPGLGSTQLRQHFAHSPATYKLRLEEPEPKTEAMVFGSAFHAAMLEPEVFELEYAALPDGIDRRTKEGKETYARWIRENVGKTPLKPREMRAIQEMVATCKDYKVLANIMDGAERELAAYAMSPMGVLLKTKADVARRDDRIICDFKTCQDADEDSFAGEITRSKYHWQAAMYLDVFSAASGKKFETFLWIAIEKAPPYKIEIHSADEKTLAEGRKKYLQHVERFAQCQASGVWPAHSGVIKPITIRPWAFTEGVVDATTG
jgi:hypothetical protein